MRYAVGDLHKQYVNTALSRVNAQELQVNAQELQVNAQELQVNAQELPILHCRGLDPFKVIYSCWSTTVVCMELSLSVTVCGSLYCPSHC